MKLLTKEDRKKNIFVYYDGVGLLLPNDINVYSFSPLNFNQQRVNKLYSVYIGQELIPVCTVETFKRVYNKDPIYYADELVCRKRERVKKPNLPLSLCQESIQLDEPKFKKMKKNPATPKCFLKVESPFTRNNIPSFKEKRFQNNLEQRQKMQQQLPTPLTPLFGQSFDELCLTPLFDLDQNYVSFNNNAQFNNHYQIDSLNSGKNQSFIANESSDIKIDYSIMYNYGRTKSKKSKRFILESLKESKKSNRREMIYVNTCKKVTPTPVRLEQLNTTSSVGHGKPLCIKKDSIDWRVLRRDRLNGIFVFEDNTKLKGTDVVSKVNGEYFCEGKKLKIKETNRVGIKAKNKLGIKGL